jgi:CMP-N-acetylneuraminic acid synthetase
MKFSVFLPVKAISQRVPRKNFTQIGRFPMGLLEIKLRQLLQSSFADEIVVSSDSREVQSFMNSYRDSRLQFDLRPPGLCSASATIESLTVHAGKIVTHPWVAWTHVTSPFFTSNMYEKAANELRKSRLEGFDSLFSAEIVQKYASFRGENLNYGHTAEKWPPTQSLEPVTLADSAVFLASRENYLDGKRLGDVPKAVSFGTLSSLDIDTEVDMRIAKSLISTNEELLEIR